MILLACSLLLVSDHVAHAECVIESEATPESTCVVMSRDGVRGVWFSLDEADTLRQLRLEVPELNFQLEVFEQFSAVQDERINLYRDSLQLRTEALSQLQGQLDLSRQREEDLRRQLGAWYRSPVLWFTVGMVMSAATYVTIMYGTD
jgi:hypothetical protein